MTKRWNPESYTAQFEHILTLCNESWMYPFKYISKPPGKVLEVGCGCGKWSALFALLGFQVTCTDKDPMMLRQVRKNFPNIKMLYKVAELPHVSDQFAEQFDVVFNEGTIEHFLDDGERLRAIDDMLKCLLPHGTLILIVPYYQIVSPPTDEFKYTPNNMEREFAQLGIHNEHIFVLNSTETTQSWLGIVVRKG